MSIVTSEHRDATAAPSVFVTHSTNGSGFAEQVAGELLRAGATVMDAGAVPAGAPWAESVQAVMCGCDAVVVILPDRGAGPHRIDLEIAAARLVAAEQPRVRIIPVAASRHAQAPPLLADLPPLPLPGAPSPRTVAAAIIAALRRPPAGPPAGRPTDVPVHR